MTDVTHLEIPADLALVFANIQGKSTAITQKQTVKSPDYEIYSNVFLQPASFLFLIQIIVQH